MIVVRVELHSAITGETTELSRVVIDNIGGTKTKGNYQCRSYRKGSPLHPLGKNVTRKAEVIGHPRLADPVLTLVKKALDALRY